MTLGFTQPLIEMSSRKKIFVGSGARPVRNADNLSAIFEPIVYNVGVSSQNNIASTAHYGDSFTLWRRNVLPVRYELDCKYCYK
jgi:hypothetical protein